MPIHCYVEQLGYEISKSLIFWYAFTGYDTVSSFNHRGKIAKWETWKVFPDITNTFMSLANKPLELQDIDSNAIEKFVCLLYSRTTDLYKVNKWHRLLFKKNSRTVDCIPPTKDALIQHTKRALYQAGYVWAQSLERIQHLPDPCKWVWKKV